MDAAPRHTIGAIYGVLMIPLVPLTLGTGFGWLVRSMTMLRFDTWQVPVGIVLVVLSGTLIGLATAPWMSPVGAAVAGGAFLLYGLGQFALLASGSRMAGGLMNADPMWLSFGPIMYVLLGTLLVMTAVWPARWRGAPGSGRAAHGGPDAVPHAAYGDYPPQYPVPGGYPAPAGYAGGPEHRPGPVDPPMGGGPGERPGG